MPDFHQGNPFRWEVTYTKLQDYKTWQSQRNDPDRVLTRTFPVIARRRIEALRKRQPPNTLMLSLPNPYPYQEMALYQ